MTAPNESIEAMMKRLVAPQGTYSAAARDTTPGGWKDIIIKFDLRGTDAMERAWTAVRTIMETFDGGLIRMPPTQLAEDKETFVRTKVVVKARSTVMLGEAA